MPDAHAAALEQPAPLNTIVTETAEFDAALIDAGRLLEHAASSGLLPEGAPPHLSERLHSSYCETPWNDRHGRQADSAKIVA
jgi:hypothetical protein